MDLKPMLKVNGLVVSEWNEVINFILYKKKKIVKFICNRFIFGLRKTLQNFDLNENILCTMQ